jgi:hypothetical protein
MEYRCTDPDVTIVGTAHKHLFTTLAHVHAIDDLVVPWMSSYPLSRLDVPTC